MSFMTWFLLTFLGSPPCFSPFQQCVNFQAYGYALHSCLAFLLCPLSFMQARSCFFWGGSVICLFSPRLGLRLLFGVLSVPVQESIIASVNCRVVTCWTLSLDYKTPEGWAGSISLVYSAFRRISGTRILIAQRTEWEICRTASYMCTVVQHIWW